MKKGFLAIMALVFALVGLNGQTIDYQSLLPKIDAQSNFLREDLSMAVTIVTDKPGKDRSVTKARLFRRDREKKFLVLIDQPVSQKGEGYLQIDSNLKFYDPNTRIFSHTSLKEKFSGSQANNDDFNSPQFAADYQVTGGEEGKIGKIDAYILTLAARNNQVTYPMVKLWVTRDKYLMLKAENYSLSKHLMRTNLYTNYQNIKGRYLPLTILFADNLNPGEKSQLSFMDISIGNIPDRVFTEAYVEQVSN